MSGFYGVPGRRDPSTAGGESGRGRPACEERGRCGPFVNSAYYQVLGARTAFADCVECGARVALPRGDRDFQSLGGMIEAIVPPSRTGD